MRNHSTISRSVLIQHIAQCVPAGHTVSLDNPEIFILVEVFKVLYLTQIGTCISTKEINRAFVAFLSYKTTIASKSSMSWKSPMRNSVQSHQIVIVEFRTKKRISIMMHIIKSTCYEEKLMRRTRYAESQKQ